MLRSVSPQGPSHFPLLTPSLHATAAVDVPPQTIHSCAVMVLLSQC
jgi:hypothetical protein